MEYVLIVFGFFGLVSMIVAFIVSLKRKTSPKHGNDNPINRIEDPCISQIVQFVRAVNEIEENGAISAWIDIYSYNKTIVCRFFDYNGSSELQMINEYSNSSYPDRDRIITSCQKRFYEKMNFSRFPQGTQLEITDHSEGMFQIHYSAIPIYQKSIRSYRSAIVNAIRQAGILFADTDKNGSFDPNRIYIINS